MSGEWRHRRGGGLAIRMLSNKGRVVEVPMGMWTNGRKQVCWKALKPRVMPHCDGTVTVHTNAGDIISTFKARSLQPTEDPHTFTMTSPTGYFGVDAHLMVEGPHGRAFTFSYLNTHDDRKLSRKVILSYGLICGVVSVLRINDF